MFPAVTIIVVALAAKYIFDNILPNFQPGSKTVDKDLIQIREEMTQDVQTLVPWDKEETALLSLKVIREKKMKFPIRIVKGVYISIYQEPLAAFYFKEYLASGRNWLTVIRTAGKEFVYRSRSDEVMIATDGKPLGIFRPNGILYQAGTNNPIAHFHVNGEGALFPVLVNGREVACVVNPARTDKVNPRAFEMVTAMSPEEETVFLAIALYYLVTARNAA